jgi:predicted metal-dependent hydrolase
LEDRVDESQVMTGEGEPAGPDPEVLLLCDDFFVIPRLQDAARAAGLSPVVIDDPKALDAEGEPALRPIPVTEPLEGSDARFLRTVVDRQPALMVFDLSTSILPWARWIQILSTSAATRRIPVLAFGPHVEAQSLQRARDLGAWKVMPRGAFLAALPGMLAEHALRTDRKAIEAACDGELDARVVEGIRLIQEGDFFGAHEHLEAAVLNTDGPESALYRVLLQVAVAYLHLERNNLRGARKMLLRLRGWLAPLPAVCRGVDLAQLREDVNALQAALDAASSEPSAPIPAGLLRPITLHGPTT